MKPLLFIAVMLYSAAITAQTNTETKEYYLNKSKMQKTTAYVLAGAGTALIISGIIVGDGDNNHNDQDGLDFGPNFDTGLWLVGGGLVCGGASIPFFISSAKNARKASSIALGHQRIFIPQLNHPVTKLQPAITLKIPL